ncbi:MAG: universal stress protein [Desulfobacteraceae bacterium]|jgi:nucleotide-binding universal stress UspA family protein
MGRKVLVAFDESDNAMRAVEFVCRHFTPDHKVTLMSVVPDTAALCQMGGPGLTPYFLSQKEAFCSLENKKNELIQEAMAQAKDRLLKAGFDEDHLVMIPATQEKGVARDILSEAGKGYDVIVLGRRGISGIKEFLLGSVSQKVLHGAEDIPVLLVG